MTRQTLGLDGKILVFIAVFALASLASALDKKETFNAMAVNMGTGPSGRTTIQITIERWSTEEARAALLVALKEKDHDEFRKALTEIAQTSK